MATLAVDSPRGQELGEFNDLLVIAAIKIFEGAAVGIVVGTGHARPLVAGDAFAGFCITQCDNSLGAAAAKRVKVLSKGRVRLAVATAVITSIGALVYAIDDDSFTLVAGGNTIIGRVARFIGGTIATDCMVEFNSVLTKA